MLQKLSSIDPRVLLKERYFITEMYLSKLIKRVVIALLNIDIVWPFVHLIDFFIYFPSSTPWNNFSACFILFILIPPISNHSVCSVWSFDFFLLLPTVLMHVIIALSDISAILTTFMPITFLFNGRVPIKKYYPFAA